MLARSFKTAADLGISEVERDALIKVLGMLERGDLGSSKSVTGDRINMGWWHAPAKCGTVACIAGWAYVVSEHLAFDFVGRVDYPPKNNQALGDLFVPLKGGCADNDQMQAITPEQTAHALSNYLTTGEPHWDLALAE